MIKILGVILIISSATMYGFKMSGELKIHCDELLELKKIMFLLRGEIEYSLCPIKEALINVADRSNEKFAKIIRNISGQSEGTFSENWVIEWKKSFGMLLLSEEEKKDIIDLNECIGLRDKESQIKQLDLYLSKLEMSICNLKEVIPGKCRIYKCLSIGFGIFLAIIII